MSKQNGIFHVSIPAKTIKTIVLQDGREIWELSIVQSPIGFHFVRSEFMDSVKADAGATFSVCTVTTKRDAIVWLEEQAASYRKMMAETRARRLAHKAANPDYAGPYDGYVF